MTEQSVEPVVVLTQTMSLSLSVLQTRDDMVAALPLLARAVWLVCADTQSDVSFVRAAFRCGTFDREDIATFPIWTTQTHGRFLVVTPESTNMHDLALQYARYQMPRRNTSSHAMRTPKTPKLAPCPLGCGVFLCMKKPYI